MYIVISICSCSFFGCHLQCGTLLHCCQFRFLRIFLLEAGTDAHGKAGQRDTVTDPFRGFQWEGFPSETSCDLQGFDCLLSIRDNYNLKSHKYVCITTFLPDTKSHPNPNPNPSHTAKQHAVVNIQLNIITFPTYSGEFIRDIVVAPSVLLLVVIVILPFAVVEVVQEQTAETSKRVSKRKRRHTLCRWSGQLFTLLLLICLHLGFSLDDLL